MSKTKIKIAIVDHAILDQSQFGAPEWLVPLGEKYGVEWFSEDPDLLLCSVELFGYAHLNYSCTKCLFSEEPSHRYPRWCYDYTFTPFPTDARNLRWLGWASRSPATEWILGQSEYCDSLKRHPRERFCNFFQRVHNAPERNEFCRLLMQRKHVDCPGEAMNNMPCPDDPALNRDQNKLEFLKHYRFSICFEHLSHPHHISELVPQALMAGSIPIHWGSTKITDYFNPECLINAHDFDSLEALADYVMEVEENPALYRRYLEAPPVLAGSKLEEVTVAATLERMEHIFSRLGIDRPFAQTWRGRFMLAYHRFHQLPSRWLARVPWGGGKVRGWLWLAERLR